MILSQIVSVFTKRVFQLVSYMKKPRQNGCSFDGALILLSGRTAVNDYLLCENGCLLIVSNWQLASAAVLLIDYS